MTEEKKYRLFGIYRSGWTDERKVKFMKRIARILYTRGAMTLGQLAAYVVTTMQDEIFVAALDALQAWGGAVTITKRPWGSAYLAETTEEQYEKFIELTSRGNFWAEGACHEEQNAGRNPRDIRA